LRHAWEAEIISEHLVYIQGVEMIYYEFKELVLDLANMVSKANGSYVAGKPRAVLKKFLDEIFLKRLIPFVKFYQPKDKSGAAVERAWPESEKDKKIREAMEERARLEAEEQARLAEEEARRAELAAQDAPEELAEAGPSASEIARAEAEA